MDGAPDFRHIYRALLARFGPQGWWPGDTPLEVFRGAVLTHSTSARAGLDAVPRETRRGGLLALRGIGPETADSILLYALGRPVFVVDAYPRRVAQRPGWGHAPRSSDA